MLDCRRALGHGVSAFQKKTYRKGAYFRIREDYKSKLLPIDNTQKNKKKRRPVNRSKDSKANILINLDVG